MLTQKLNRIIYTHLFWAMLLFSLLPGAAMADTRITPDLTKDNLLKGIAVSEGRLIFADMNTFSAFMDNIVNQDNAVLDRIEENLGFLSMRRNANQQEPPTDQKGEDIDEDYWMWVTDAYFATALNPDGLIQIGEEIYKVTKDKVYKGSEQSHTLLLEANLHDKHATTLAEIEVFEVQSDTIALFQFGNNCFDTDGDYRLKGRSWVSNWIIYSSAGAYSEFQQQKKFLWWRWWRLHNANSLSLDSRYELTVSGLPVSGAYSNTLSNEDKLHKVHAWVAGIGPSVFINGTVSSSHKATHNGTSFSCSTSDSW